MGVDRSFVDFVVFCVVRPLEPDFVAQADSILCK
jgi:hypothetical protein